MQIIPVIDLKQGQVVHAVRGQRNQYQPIHLHSRLTASSEPRAVLEGFLKLYPFHCFYIADLDAICGHGNHQALITDLLEQYPQLAFWLDNGSQLDVLNTAEQGRLTRVIGTESQLSPPRQTAKDFILSLDYLQQASGHEAWFSDSSFWPMRVIVMTLSRVGSNSGPDFRTLREFANSYPEHEFIAAGGIRDADDLVSLAALGIRSALLATALHTGAIDAQIIKNLQAKKYPGKPGYF